MFIHDIVIGISQQFEAIYTFRRSVIAFCMTVTHSQSWHQLMRGLLRRVHPHELCRQLANSEQAEQLFSVKSPASATTTSLGRRCLVGVKFHYIYQCSKQVLRPRFQHFWAGCRHVADFL